MRRLVSLPAHAYIGVCTGPERQIKTMNLNRFFNAQALALASTPRHLQATASRSKLWFAKIERDVIARG